VCYQSFACNVVSWRKKDNKNGNAYRVLQHCFSDKKEKRFGNAYADIYHTCINQNGNGKELVEGRRNMVVTSVPVVDR